MYPMKTRSGYTLVEVVISIAVGMIIIGAIYAAVIASQRFTVDIDRKIVAGQDARAALDLMAMEIQMASFNPTNAEALWRDPASCSAQASDMKYKGIQAATASSISVEADINENGTVAKSGDPNTNPNEIITYAYDATNQYITRETSCGNHEAFLGDSLSSGRPRAVRVINPTGVPVFRYYDTQNNPINTSAGIPNIARIDITLYVETEGTASGPGQRRQMVYTTSIIPRNHVINIGR
jgi:Tfp pilus assembly protein PilW